MKNRKAPGLDGVPPEVWKTKAFNDILCNEVYNGNHIEVWNEGCVVPFPKKGDLGITGNYRGITLTSIVDKIYNTMILNTKHPALETIFRKNQNGFLKTGPQFDSSSTICRLLKSFICRLYSPSKIVANSTSL